MALDCWGVSVVAVPRVPVQGVQEAWALTDESDEFWLEVLPLCITCKPQYRKIDLDWNFDCNGRQFLILQASLSFVPSPSPKEIRAAFGSAQVSLRAQGS